MYILYNVTYLTSPKASLVLLLPVGLLLTSEGNVPFKLVLSLGVSDAPFKLEHRTSVSSSEVVSSQVFPSDGKSRDVIFIRAALTPRVV
jgi:hypothetical protein